MLEGKYQKRKVDAVAREYRKWRLHHREKFVRRRSGERRDEGRDGGVMRGRERVHRCGEGKLGVKKEEEGEE